SRALFRDAVCVGVALPACLREPSIAGRLRRGPLPSLAATERSASLPSRPAIEGFLPLYSHPFMELIRGLSGVRPRHQGSVVTIGTFDGIHPGHRALIDALLAHGRRLGRPAMMLTFEPMPREYLAAANPPARLTSWRERWRVLQRTGLSYVLQLKFDEKLRGVTGDAFTKLLANELKVAAVVIGHDFKFGRNGEASAPMLQEAGRRL